ncbi:hypothetical protein [uncultured Kordia sp.]|uniref:hypothetical protein n=1 Tax=uncultured Kordia sp. TaxID=507699 RepID=UPI0026224204|nr:hypothetical protein [uncultured Kordia sp.]
MKYIRLVFINLGVLLALLFVVAIIAYFVGKHQINTFFDMTTPRKAAYFQKDSLAMFIHKPNIHIFDRWGTNISKITTERRTNNLGFRENEDIIAKKTTEYRVLITGDSHTDGVLKYNHMSFINRWEALLNEADCDINYNCINGGNGFYTFRNYAGFLKKYTYLQPDTFLINVFTGNDFREASIYEDDRTSIPNVFKNIYSRISRRFYSTEQKSISYTQGLEQILHFKSFPNDKKAALELAKKYIRDIKQLCTQNNIQLVVTLQPSKIEARPDFKKYLQELFDLTDEDMLTNQQLTNEFASWLSSEGITHYNLLAPLKDAEGIVFWTEDLHINPEGHRIIGEYLFNQVELQNNRLQ